MKWQVIESGRLAPAAIMAHDAWLLQNLEKSAQPILHLYEWEGDCLTYGHFVDPSRYLDLQEIDRYGIRMARRPTGGGIIFHLTDFAFSVLIPASHPDFSSNTLDNYALINRQAARAVRRLTGDKIQPELFVANDCGREVCANFCMSQPTQYDLIVNGQKVGGAAQRRTRHGFLHQGTISLILPPQPILKSVIKDETVLLAMQKNSYGLLGDLGAVELEQARGEMRKALAMEVKEN